MDANIAYVTAATELKAMRPRTVTSSPEVKDASHETPLLLPRMEIPTFSGSYTEWEPFRDAFEGMVVNRQDLPGFQKLLLLKQALKGPAALLVQNVTTTEVNFEPTWKEVCARYTNIRLLAQAHLQKLFDLPPVSKCSHSDMRHLLDRTKEEVRALKTLKCPAAHWDDMLVFLTLKRLDSVTCRDWQRCRLSSNWKSS
jgi:hypothetical protein